MKWMSMSLVLLAACATSGTNIYTAATSETVRLESEDSPTGDGQTLYVLNESSVEIVVTSVQLSGCENVKQRCEVHQMATRVAPRSRRVVFRVQAAVPDIGFSYRSGFGWRSEAAAPAIRSPADD
ncbi:MAG: hypothetical protein ACT4OZ_09635 [Gemmatimonadota bacterium]